jgi:hypothetical protein
MDLAFDRLHAAYFANAVLPWEEFTAAALQYFDSNAGAPPAHDAYFNNFTVIWRSIIDTGRLDHAEHVWELALQPALSWEQANQDQRLHKGTPYYFWAMTALLRGNTDYGYILIHQSLDEDIRSSGQQTPDTPGYALVSLNYEKLDQAFRPWVVEQAAFVNDLITNYSVTHTRALRIEDVRQRFFEAPPDIETVFLLTYTIARLRRIAHLPRHVTRNTFAGQLEINLLFDVALVIDAAIKAKNQAHWQFIQHAGCLLKVAGHALTHQQLGELSGQFERDFDATLRAALEGTMTIQLLPLDRLQCDVALAYGLRNRGAHNVASVPTIWKEFPSVQHALFRVFFATIDYLY